jgi:hypothetical protein
LSNSSTSKSRPKTFSGALTGEFLPLANISANPFSNQKHCICQYLPSFAKASAGKNIPAYRQAGQYLNLTMLLSNELLFVTAEKSALADAKGGFARQVAVLALKELNGSSNRDFLDKVLTAAQLNLAQDALLAEIPAGEPRTLSADFVELQPKQVLVFGLSPAQLGLSFEIQAYQPLTFYGCTWLFADPLSAIESDKTKKTQLWSALKQMFL